MEFGIDKCTLLIMKSGKRQMTEVTELPNKKNENFQRNRNLQICVNIGNGHHQTRGNERKNKMYT